MRGRCRSRCTSSVPSWMRRSGSSRSGVSPTVGRALGYGAPKKRYRHLRLQRAVFDRGHSAGSHINAGCRPGIQRQVEEQGLLPFSRPMTVVRASAAKRSDNSRSLKARGRQQFGLCRRSGVWTFRSATPRIPAIQSQIALNDRFLLRRKRTIDPFRSDNFLQTGLSAKARFCELECYEADVGHLTQSARSGRSGRPWATDPGFRFQLRCGRKQTE